jgi:chloramphenicol-sensitive protein RarD
MPNNAFYGWLFGFGSFFLWGLFPIYFKALESIPAEEILAHRIAWCAPFTLMVMLLLRKKILIKTILHDKKVMFGLTFSTLLISCNWYLFTWAVTNNQILATSLGYFINPIMSILIGVIFLSEKLSKLQWAALLAVIIGVMNQIFNYGEVPWIALALATSFAIYGFVRKQLNVNALNGLLFETTIALPFAVAYLIWLSVQEVIHFSSSSLSIDLLLICGGAVTAIPLMLFASAAKKIPLNAIGFLQFVAPTISFFLATQVYKEQLGSEQLISFTFIWIGLILYLVAPIKSMLKQIKQPKKA